MTQTAVAAEVTYVAEYSFEATTLDYLTPHWYPFSEVEPFTSKEEAEAFVAAKYAERAAAGGEPVAYQARMVKAPRPEQGYSDPFLEAEFAANRAYWADRAAAARQQQEAVAEMYRAFGKGAEVKVVKGRKVPVGTEGVVFWLGESTYQRGEMRVGFKASTGEKHYTALSNVESTKAASE